MIYGFLILCLYLNFIYYNVVFPWIDKSKEGFLISCLFWVSIAVLSYIIEFHMLVLWIFDIYMLIDSMF